MSQHNGPPPGEAIVLKVEYQHPTELLSDYLTEIDDGGLFIRTDAPFQVGDTVRFALSFPGLLAPVPVNGQVAFRNETPDQRHPRGIGVAFDLHDPEARFEIEALLRRLRREAEQDATGEDQRPFRVLLVEDNSFVHELFQHAIRRYHRDGQSSGRPLEIVLAQDGREALDRLSEDQIDLAIVDHYLPELTGVQIVESLRADPRLRDIPVLVVSVGGEGLREQALAAGADLFIEKPVLLKQLLNTLSCLLAPVGSATGVSL